jgi:hypothetical protein
MFSASRRQPYGAFLQACTELQIATLLFRAGACVSASLSQTKYFFSPPVCVFFSVRFAESRNLLHFENCALVGGDIHAGITLGGLGCISKAHSQLLNCKTHVVCRKGGVGEARFNSHCEPCPAVCKAHCWSSGKIWVWAGPGSCAQ